MTKLKEIASQTFLPALPIAWLLIITLLTARSAIAQPPAIAQSPDAAELTAQIETAQRQWQVPGLAVAIVKDGKVLLSQGFGVREQGRPEAVDQQTLFAIASNTKAFTAAAICMLEDEGRLRRDDRVQQHLPWLQFSEHWTSTELRIDDLLCHRSGLGTFSGDLLWWGTPYSPEEVLRRMRHLPLRNRFRAEYGYSNLMFLAAGEVIRSASGQSWQEFVRSRILQPLEMHRTALSTTELPQLGNAATPHKTSTTGNMPIPWVNWDTMAAAGGVISCSDDMAKWLLLQLRRGRLETGVQLFSRAASHLMWSPHTVIPVSEAARERTPSTHFRSCGLGWMLADYRGRQTVGHGGGYDGMYSQVLLIPEEQLGIVVLTNSMTGLPQALCMAIADRFLGGPTRDWLAEGLTRDQNGRLDFAARIAEVVKPKASGTQPSHALAAYTGTWRCPLYGEASIVEENGRLVLRLLPNPDLVADLEHLHYDTFVIRWRNTFAWFAEGTIHFVPDADGVFQDLRLNVPNDDLWFDELQLRRIPDGRN